jgi:hypothetical protein
VSLIWIQESARDRKEVEVDEVLEEVFAVSRPRQAPPRPPRPRRRGAHLCVPRLRRPRRAPPRLPHPRRLRRATLRPPWLCGSRCAHLRSRRLR